MATATGRPASVCESWGPGRYPRRPSPVAPSSSPAPNRPPLKMATNRLLSRRRREPDLTKSRPSAAAEEPPRRRGPAARAGGPGGARRTPVAWGCARHAPRVRRTTGGELGCACAPGQSAAHGGREAAGRPERREARRASPRGRVKPGCCCPCPYPFSLPPPSQPFLIVNPLPPFKI